MSELHEALSHLQPHEEHHEHERFDEDLDFALASEHEKEEREREWREDFDHEYSDDHYPDFGYDDDYYDHQMVHLPERFHSERTYGEELEEEASWRDEQERSHDGGFDLRENPHHEYQEEDSYFYQQ